MQLKQDRAVRADGGRAGVQALRRAGTDPAASVLNVDCRAHEVDNLYVVDTSFGAVNPALTAAAYAIRVGDHLLDRLHASTPPEPERAVAAR
jgi:choline dehydrogenase-like flavoprotein